MRDKIGSNVFQWDEEKARRNKHSVNEDRWITVGMVEDVLFAVYTERGEDIRLISARAADDDERREYDEYNSSDDR